MQTHSKLTCTYILVDRRAQRYSHTLAHCTVHMHTHTLTHASIPICSQHTQRSNMKHSWSWSYAVGELGIVLTVFHSWFSLNTIKLVIVSSSFIYQPFEISGLPLRYRVSTILPSFHRTKLERDSIRSSIVNSITNALYFSMWNNTKRWPMYIMLSIEATVYADSSDKYSSIFKISRREKKGLLSVFKYVKYLQVFWSLIAGVGRSST